MSILKVYFCPMCTRKSLMLTPILLSGLLSLSHLTYSQHNHATGTTAVTDTLKKSIPKEVHAQLGTAHHMIHYYSPGVRERAIWGGLVPYDEVWVTGAHRATTWEFDKAIEINGVHIPAGKYAFFTIPGKKKWVLILNRKWDQHLADEYTEAEDVIRVEVDPQKSKKHQERLAYYLKPDKKNNARLTMRWEKISVSLPFILIE